MGRWAAAGGRAIFLKAQWRVWAICIRQFREFGPIGAIFLIHLGGFGRILANFGDIS